MLEAVGSRCLLAVQLNGRVLEFHQVEAGGIWLARVTLELGLSEASGRLVFQQEFTSSRPMAHNDPEQLVIALSEGMAEVVEQVLARCEADGLFERGLRAPPGK